MTIVQPALNAKQALQPHLPPAPPREQPTGDVHGSRPVTPPPAPAAVRQLLAGWGGATRSAATVHHPTRLEHVEAVLRDASPHGVIARGAGRSYGDAAQNAGGHVVELNHVEEPMFFDAQHGLVTVSAGLTIEALLQRTVPAGWMLPVVPGTRYVTVGGAIAADVHGKNHFRAGSFANCVRSLVLVTPTGIHIADRDHDPELFWATTGGMGLTGIITQATLALTRITTGWYHTRTWRTHGLDATLAAIDLAARNNHAVAWIDPTASGRHLGRAVITTARPMDATDNNSDPFFRSPAPLGIRDPSTTAARLHLVRPAVIRAMAAARWHTCPNRPKEKRQTVDAALFPLDRVAYWNRLFGRRGLIQWQCAIPEGHESNVARLLTTVLQRGPVSPLISFKRLGPATPAPLSFPLRGWTLAIDLPADSENLTALLDLLDQIACTCHGRVYLAKDARLRPEDLRAMYPRLPEWMAVRRRVDPDAVLCSDLARRLQLSETT